MQRYEQFILFFVVAFNMVNPSILAQHELQYNQISDDSLFIKARSLAFEGYNEMALGAAMFLLDRNNSYYDASVLVARIYAWENQYDSARVYLDSVTDNFPGYYDALSALIDVEIWDGNYLQAAGTANTALSYHPDDEIFLLKKAKAFHLQGSKEDAKETLEYLLEINPYNEEALKLLNSMDKPGLYHYRENNYLLGGYYGDFFQKPYSRHLHTGTAGYSYYSRQGPLTGKLNFANVYFDGTGLTRYPSFQYEVESYPKLSADAYLLLNYAYSRSSVFPGHRGAFEYFRNLPRGFEASLGLRFLHWDKNYLFYTGSAGKYYENMWFSLRTYILPDDPVASSWFFNARRYFNSADEYAGIIFGYGFSPDETILDPDDRIYLNTTSVGIELSKGLGSDYLIRSSLRYEYEEFNTGLYRNRWRVNLGLRYYL